MISIQKLEEVFEKCGGVEVDDQQMADWRGPQELDFDDLSAAFPGDVVLELFRTTIDDGSDVDHAFTLQQLLDGEIQKGIELHVENDEGIRYKLEFHQRTPIFLDV